jgi:hypothetical protein
VLIRNSRASHSRLHAASGAPGHRDESSLALLIRFRMSLRYSTSASISTAARCLDAYMPTAFVTKFNPQHRPRHRPAIVEEYRHTLARYPGREPTRTCRRASLARGLRSSIRRNEHDFFHRNACGSRASQDMQLQQLVRAPEQRDDHHGRMASTTPPRAAEARAGGCPRSLSSCKRMMTWRPVMLYWLECAAGECDAGCGQDRNGTPCVA